MKQVFLGLGLILGAAGAVASGFQQPIEISPARPVLAEGKLQLLSEGLMVPLVHALVQSNSAPVVVRRADGLGVVDAWSWSPDLQLAWNHGPGSAAGEPAAPQSSAARQTTTPPKPLPENRWAWSRVCSLLIDVPSERVPPALDQLHAAVLTASGELWPARVLGLEPFESQWVVRIQEEDRFVGEDPARTILLRIEREADSAIDAQFWSVQELRACVSKPWVEQKTGTVEVHAEQGMPFGDRIGAQTLSALQLIPESPFPALTHTAALGWLACPDPSHRTFLSSRVARIRGVPVGSIQILATLTGSTTVAQTTTVEPGKTRVVELFETQVLGGTSVLNPPSSEQPWEVVRDWPRGVQFVSWVWGPLGNLYSAQGWEVLDPEAPETNPLEAPALPSWRVPSDGVFGWQRLVVGDDGSAVHSWQTFPAEAQQAPFWTQFGAQGRKPSARLLELTEQPSTVWSGTLVLFLFQ
ncbi:MAG TPA: hypothetical protein PLJ12_07000, partial [Planctomycetota bacterium]|nr:hypothetical protein [Planctomycetota bacterium]